MVDLKKIQQEMDEMSKALEEPDVGEEDLRTDPPGTDPPGTPAPSTDPPKTEAPPTKAPPTQAPKTEAPHTEPPREDPRDAELRKLREENEELRSRRATKAPPTKAPPTQAPSTDPPISEEDFLGDVDLDELTRDPKKFNLVLNKIYKKAREDMRIDSRLGGEAIVKSIPGIVKNTIALETQLREVNEKFYKDNKDLIPWKKSVATVFEEMISENPSKRYDELLPGVATEVRKRLGLQEKATDNDNDPPPNLPKKKGGRQRQTEPPNPDPLLKEMDEMDKALELD